MLRRVLLASLLALTLPVAVAHGGGPAAHASRSCDIGGEERDFGATYVNSLSAKGTSCSSAKAIVRAYHDCRGSGKSCGRKVDGYKCSQKVLEESPLQYDAKVTCKHGSKKIKHTYTQNT